MIFGVGEVEYLEGGKEGCPARSQTLVEILISGHLVLVFSFFSGPGQVCLSIICLVLCDIKFLILSCLMFFKQPILKFQVLAPCSGGKHHFLLG